MILVFLKEHQPTLVLLHKLRVSGSSVNVHFSHYIFLDIKSCCIGRQKEFDGSLGDPFSPYPCSNLREAEAPKTKWLPQSHTLELELAPSLLRK